MKRTVVTKEIILQKGIPFDNLANEYCSDRMLNREGGIPFSGLTYELYDNGNMSYYSYYVDGFADGDFVEFYKDGSVCSFNKMKRGQVIESIEWYHDGKIKEEGIYSFGICISNKKWDEQGNLTYEKVSPTEKEKLLIKKLSSVKND